MSSFLKLSVLSAGEIVQYMKFCGATKLLFDTSYASVAEQVQDLTAVEVSGFTALGFYGPS